MTARGQKDMGKFSDDMANAIISLIRSGMRKGPASSAVGISDRTLRRWRRRGRAGEQPFADFSARLDQAEAQVLSFGSQTIFRAGRPDLRKPFCRHCDSGPQATVECCACGQDVAIACNDCGRRLFVSVPGDWRAMDRWMARTFPIQWGGRIDLDLQAQLRAFLTACRIEFAENPEIFDRILSLARQGAGPGGEPHRNAR